MKSLDNELKHTKNKPEKFSENYINYLIGLLNKINYSKIAECIDKIEEARIKMIKQFLLWEMEVQPQLLLMLQMTLA